MDLDRLHVPLSLFPDDDPGVLRARMIAALQACAEAALGCPGIEVRYEEDSEQLRVWVTVPVTEDNLEAARGFGEVEAGEELILDVWLGIAEYLQFMGVSEEAWEDLRERGMRALRGVLTAGRTARAAAALRPWLAEHQDRLAAWRRDAWLPEVEAGLAEVGGVYYGGPAWLAADEAWPTCGACGAALELLLHLDLAATPIACGVCETYEVFVCEACKQGELARVVPPGAAPRGSLTAPRRGPKRVTGWRRVDDYSGFAADDHAFQEVMAIRGDKLGGWPARLQASREEKFPCPACAGATLLVFQLDSDGHAERRWGDLGRAWLSVCPVHPGRPLFFWECS